MSLTEQTLKARYIRLIRFLHRTTGKYRELFLIPQTKSGDFISPDTLKRLPTYQVKKKLRSPGVLSIIIEVSDHVVEEARKDLEGLQKFEATRKRHTPIPQVKITPQNANGWSRTTLPLCFPM